MGGQADLTSVGLLKPANTGSVGRKQTNTVDLGGKTLFKAGFLPNQIAVSYWEGQKQRVHGARFNIVQCYQ